jgi:hypothetical protein
MFVERRKSWSFYIVGDGWVWRVLYPDGTVRTADRAFPTLEACQADAANWGYVAWKPENERRRTPPRA